MNETSQTTMKSKLTVKRVVRVRTPPTSEPAAEPPAVSEEPPVPPPEVVSAKKITIRRVSKRDPLVPAAPPPVDPAPVVTVPVKYTPYESEIKETSYSETKISQVEIRDNWEKLSSIDDDDDYGLGDIMAQIRSENYRRSRPRTLENGESDEEDDLISSSLLEELIPRYVDPEEEERALEKKRDIDSRLGGKATHTIFDMITSLHKFKGKGRKGTRKTILKKKSDLNSSTEEFPELGSAVRNLPKTSSYSDENIYSMLETIQETINFSERVQANAGEQRSRSLCDGTVLSIPMEKFVKVYRRFSVCRVLAELATVRRVRTNLESIGQIIPDMLEVATKRVSERFDCSRLLERETQLSLVIRVYNVLNRLKIYWQECIDSIITIADRFHDTYGEKNELNSKINCTFNTSAVISECDAQIACKPKGAFDCLKTAIPLRNSTDKCRIANTIIEVLEKLLDLPSLPFEDYSEFRNQVMGLGGQIDNLNRQIIRENDNGKLDHEYMITIVDDPNDPLIPVGINSWCFVPYQDTGRIKMVGNDEIYLKDRVLERAKRSVPEFNVEEFASFLLGYPEVRRDGFLEIVTRDARYHFNYLLTQSIPDHIRGFSITPRGTGERRVFFSSFPRERVHRQIQKEKERENEYHHRYSTMVISRTQMIVGAAPDSEMEINEDHMDKIKKAVRIELRQELDLPVDPEDEFPITPEEKDLDDLFHRMMSDSEDSYQCFEELRRIHSTGTITDRVISSSISMTGQIRWTSLLRPNY